MGIPVLVEDIKAYHSQPPRWASVVLLLTRGYPLTQRGCPARPVGCSRRARVPGGSPLPFRVLGLSRQVTSDSATPRTVAHQAPLSMGHPRQEYWSGLPCPPPGHLPHPGIEPKSPAVQVSSLPLSRRGSPAVLGRHTINHMEKPPGGHRGNHPTATTNPIPKCQHRSAAFRPAGVLARTSGEAPGQNPPAQPPLDS